MNVLRATFVLDGVGCTGGVWSVGPTSTCATRPRSHTQVGYLPFCMAELQRSKTLTRDLCMKNGRFRPYSLDTASSTGFFSARLAGETLAMRPTTTASTRKMTSWLHGMLSFSNPLLL